MKLELIKEIDPVREEVWFIVKVDESKQYFGTEGEAKRRYDALKELKSTEKQQIILESEEIDVSSEENNQTWQAN